MAGQQNLAPQDTSLQALMHLNETRLHCQKNVRIAADNRFRSADLSQIEVNATTHE